MKLSQKEIRRIIQEELQSVLTEAEENEKIKIALDWMDEYENLPVEEKKNIFLKIADYLKNIGKYEDGTRITRRNFLIGAGTLLAAGSLAGLHGQMTGHKQARLDREEEEAQKRSDWEFRKKSSIKKPRDMLPIEGVRWESAPARYKGVHNGRIMNIPYAWINPKDLEDGMNVPSEQMSVGQWKEIVKQEWGDDPAGILKHIWNPSAHGYSQREGKFTDPYPGVHFDPMDGNCDDCRGKEMLSVGHSATVEVARELWIVELNRAYSTSVSETGGGVPEDQIAKFGKYLMYDDVEDFRNDLKIGEEAIRTNKPLDASRFRREQETRSLKPF